MGLPELRLDTWWLTIITIGLIGVHLLGVVLAIHVLMRGRSPQGTTAWILTLLLWPTVSVWFYLAFGLRRFSGYAVARTVGDAPIHRLGLELARSAREAGLDRPSDHPDLETIAGLGRIPTVDGNRLELLIDGQATFDSIFAGIAAARHSVTVQFFIIHDDATGRRLQDALIERARAGVRCLLLYDEIGSHALPRRYLRRLRREGVALSAFNTRRGILHRFRINFRNHRKVVVVDGVRAWIGGHNIGDRYLQPTRRYGRWRDTHLRIDGPAALACQLSFAEDWFWATGTLPDLPWEIPEAAGDAEVLIVPTGPADLLETGTLLFMEAITGATRRLWIASPYFVPDSAIGTAIQLAALRGVDVRIMIPARPDKHSVWWAAHTYLEDLCRTGVRFYAYRSGFMHQKVALVDDRYATVGTANLDNRSLRINFEITAVSTDQTFIRQVEAMLERDLEACDPLEASAFTEAGVFFRLRARIARLFAPLL